MNIVHTTLTTSGNSVAVRLPQQLLRMSGLRRDVALEVRQGAIIIRNTSQKRANWENEIDALLNTYGDPTQEFHDIESSNTTELPWDGPSYEDWLKDSQKKSHEKSS